MKNLIRTIIMLFHFGSSGQEIDFDKKFNFLIQEEFGDLNRDNLTDKVLIFQDTLNEKQPYLLQIFFKEQNGKFKHIVTSAKIIETKYPNGKEGINEGNEFSNVTINKGVLTINFELLRGHYEHKFRYQNLNFELIGFSEVYSNGYGEMRTTDFNLSTGVRKVKIERYDTEEILSNTKKKILIKPLPKLQDITPRENDYY